MNLQPVQDVIKQIRKLLDAWRKYELPVYHTREGKEGESSPLTRSITQKRPQTRSVDFVKS